MMHDRARRCRGARDGNRLIDILLREHLFFQNFEYEHRAGDPHRDGQNDAR